MKAERPTGYNKAWAEKVGRDKFLEQHAHIDGAAEWFDKHVGPPKEEKTAKKAEKSTERGG